MNTALTSYRCEGGPLDGSTMKSTGTHCVELLDGDGKPICTYQLDLDRGVYVLFSPTTGWWD